MLQLISVLLYRQLLALATINPAAADAALPLHDSLLYKEKSTHTIRYNVRQNTVGAATAASSGGSMLLLNQAWYKQYEKTSLHSFDDSKEWLQVDKLGHAWFAYSAAHATTALWRWAGTENKKAVLLGSCSSLAYMTVIEALDASSAKWGWSWADMSANVSGIGLFAAQQLSWGGQRIQFKFSAAPHRYEPHLQQRADELFGATFNEQILKDYNVQTYWLCFNLNAFYKKSSLPAWLNIAIGYGAEGMWGGFENTAFDADGKPTFDRRDIARRRQWYIAPDVDLSKIKTGNKTVRTLLTALNCIKFPAPALEWSDGKIKGRWMAF